MIVADQVERRKDPVLQNISVHRQYVGIPRAEGSRAGDIRMVLRPDKDWFWFIPIDAETINVGVVIPQAIYRSASRSTPEATLGVMITSTNWRSTMREAVAASSC